MSEPSIEVNITEWIDSVNTDPIAHAQRQITEIILHAIAMTPFLAGPAIHERRLTDGSWIW